MSEFKPISKRIPPVRRESIPPRSVKMTVAEIVREADRLGISYGQYQGRRRDDECRHKEVIR